MLINEFITRVLLQLGDKRVLLDEFINEDCPDARSDGIKDGLNSGMTGGVKRLMGV